MSDDVLSERVRKKKMRNKFILYLGLVFVIFTVLAFFVLPTLEKNTGAVVGQISHEQEASADVLSTAVTVFKISWIIIGLGCLGAAVLAYQGLIDALIPPLQFVLVLLGAGAIGVTIFAYYSRIISVLPA